MHLQRLTALGVLLLCLPAWGQEPVSFRHVVVPALSIAGCNSGQCHGNSSGKNGFKLSLRGGDPEADYLALTRDQFGRRVQQHDPVESLLLQKALGRIAHEGGRRFDEDSLPARILATWMAQGLKYDLPDSPTPRKLEIYAPTRSLEGPNREVPLNVVAVFSDGEGRDVSPLTVFSSSNEAIAKVDAAGRVTFAKQGEVAILCRYLDRLASITLSYLEPRPGFVWPGPPIHNLVDRYVFAKLERLHLASSVLCSDEVFLRRATLDLCGVLPTPREVEEFLADPNPNKRAKVVDRLLDRPEYADFFTLHWLDLLKANRRLLGAEGVTALQGWMREQVRKNTPWPQVAKELILAKGNTFDNGPANFYRASRTPEDVGESVAQVFLGVRLQCAKCHNHPFERWTQDDYFSLAAFFPRVDRKKDPDRDGAEVIRSILSGEVTHPRQGYFLRPRFLGGPAPDLASDADRRAVFADWLTSDSNPFFARALVNRLWFHCLGKGIVDPPDDLRDSNPASHEPLLDALAQEFRQRKGDVKHILRLIVNSRTYQLSSITNESNRDDAVYFSHAYPRLLSAEQMLDALCQATEVPERFPGMPIGSRAVQALGGDGTHPLLRALGLPPRELNCECERQHDGGISAALVLLNGSAVQERMIHPRNRLSRLLNQGTAPTDVVKELYLATLSRSPRPEETRRCLEYLTKHEEARKAWEDIFWTLINSREFLYRH